MMAAIVTVIIRCSGEVVSGRGEGHPVQAAQLRARQVEKGKAFAIKEIVWRLDDDLDRRVSCVHIDGDFSIPEIDFVAASISAPENGMCHV
jgi:hypothetical protein